MREGTTAWVEVASKLGGTICSFAKGADRYQWNSRSELVLDYVRFVFDWERMFSDTSPVDNPALNKEQAEKQDVSQQFLNRLLKMVSAYGVVRLGDYSVSPSGNRIAFAGEFEGPAYKPKTNLWLVNRDGTGLQRLTKNYYSTSPAWSPSGKEIAFTDLYSVKIMDVKTRKVRSLPGLQPKEPRIEYDRYGYGSPRWSPNGKAIAAVGYAANGGVGWITVVEARSGTDILQAWQEPYFAWNREGELVIENDGKFVFDWSSGIFNRR